MPIRLLVYVFFCYVNGYHRDLHSFPTRRSSDLPEFLKPFAPGKLPFREAQQARRTLRPDQPALRLAPVLLPRSEEHTFELQSRQYLVCRLLLEKKNKMTTMESQRKTT